MTTNGTAIDDLELSVRTAAYVQSLGVTTLEELLAVPRLVLERKMMAAELRELFADRGVAYAGEMVVDEPVVATVAGDVLARWAAVAAWLSEHRPAALASFHPPAAAAAIAAAEVALGQTLPEDYRRFLAVHDGQEEGGPMVGTCSLFPVAELAESHGWLGTLFEHPKEVASDLVGDGVRAMELVNGWIPIGKSARGRDYLCLDLDPAEGGTRGQIIKVAVDFDDRPVVAASFTELLSVFYTGLQTGEIGGDDEDGGEDRQDDTEEDDAS